MNNSFTRITRSKTRSMQNKEYEKEVEAAQSVCEASVCEASVCEATLCIYCSEESGHLKYCPLNKRKIDARIQFESSDEMRINEDSTEKVKDIRIPKRTYTTVCAGMGCSWVIRNNGNKHQYIFMHSDNWGQYGKDTSHLPLYKAFIHGYSEHIL